MKAQKHTFLILFILLLSSSIWGQSKEVKGFYKFVLSDSSKIVGSIFFEDENIVQIKSLDGHEYRLNKVDVIEQKSVKVDVANLEEKGILYNLSEVNLYDSSSVYRIELIGGSVIIGSIVNEDSTSITVNMLSNTQTTINKSMIETKVLVSNKIKNGEYWFIDPNKTRLFFAPTGRGLKGGEGYFSVAEIFFPMLAIGVGDFFTLAGGISLFPGGDQLLYFAPKLTPYQDDEFAVSVGDFYVKYPSSTNSLNIAYAVSTVSINNFSLTAGMGIETNEKNAVLMLGGEVRASRYAKFITENWFFNNGDINLLSFGIRFFGTNLAADFAFIFPWDEGIDSNLFPWISFAYNF